VRTSLGFTSLAPGPIPADRSGLGRHRPIKAIVVGGTDGGVGSLLVGALRRDPRVETAEHLAEAVEALIWARFGSANLVVVFPDSAPLPPDFSAELESHDCRLAGVFLAGDAKAEALLVEAGISLIVQADDDLEVAARQIVQMVVRPDRRIAFGNGSPEIHRPVHSPIRRVAVLVAVGSLGASAGSTTLAAAMARVLVERGYRTAVADFDRDSAGLSHWLAPARKMRSGNDSSSVGGLENDNAVSNLRARAVSLPTGECLVRALTRPQLEESERLLDGDLLDQLVRQFQAVVVDVGRVAHHGIPRDGVGGLQAISRLMAYGQNPASSWILVCRADPLGLRALLEDLSPVSSRLGELDNAVAVANGIPPNVPARKFASFRKSVLQTLRCRAVVGLPHDPLLRTSLWKGAFDPGHVAQSDFFAGIRSLLDAIGAKSSESSPPVDGQRSLGIRVGSLLRRWRSE
jgi:hypothetical protein